MKITKDRTRLQGNADAYGDFCFAESWTLEVTSQMIRFERGMSANPNVLAQLLTVDQVMD